LINGLTYAKASNYVSVPAGSYTFNVVIAQQNAILQVPTQLKAWTITSIFAVGSLSHGNVKFQFVDAQVNGMPGMPATGSDPHALTSTSQSPMPWLFACLILISVAAGVPAYQLATAGKRLPEE
jgi:hypothetical protein